MLSEQPEIHEDDGHGHGDAIADDREGPRVSRVAFEDQTADRTAVEMMSPSGKQGAASAVGTVPAESATKSRYDQRRSTRVPLIFVLLSALRKFGINLSMISKYDESAGVFCCALYNTSSR